MARSYELHSYDDEYISLIINTSKLYGMKYIVFVYAQSIEEMEVTTTIFKWTRVLSREGFTISNLYFSELKESSCYIKMRIVHPYYIPIISSYNAIKQFSLATTTIDMSYVVWLVLFVYKGYGFDYCHNPPVPDSLYERRHNLHGLTMRAVIVKDSPFVNINKNNELEGVFGRVLKELSVTLNFSLKIVSKVNEYGRWNPKENTWSGAIGEIYAGRADISISDFSMTSARLNVVDFTMPLVFSKNCIFIKEPNKFAIKWSSYFQTFSHSVWIAMFGVLVLAMIVLVFLKRKNGTDRNIGQLLSDNFLEIWGIFCQQGLADFPDRFSLRIAYFSIFLLAVVLSAAYSAALISFLTSVMQTLPFHSLEGFVEDGTYQFAVLRGTADYDIVANAKDPLAKKLMELMPEEKKLPITLKQGFNRICKNQKLALYTSIAKKEGIRFKIPCNVIPISAGRIESLAIILSKHNPFTEVINFHLQKFINNGMMNRLKDATFKKKLNFMLNHEPVHLSSVISLIFFILIGIITSICILIIEKYIFVRKRKMLIVHNIFLKKSSGFYVKRKNNIKNIVKNKGSHKCTRVN
uniref:glutamate receptor 1-like isoform X1 n=1 Tax=Vespula vulgaris TaxID=7454 RepID=UPI00223AC12E|nr:glutamate receptor 1-like isoform X1 [Vespula vulgaris]